jgi:hypothetical protein
MRATAQHLTHARRDAHVRNSRSTAIVESAKWTEVDSPSSDEFGDELVCQSQLCVSGVLW